MNAIYSRAIRARIAEALQDTPVVLLAGPRQSGKTTLVRQFSGQGWDYVTLDDELMLLAAREDATGIIKRADHLVIDEVQRAPQLLLAIKKRVDENRRPGMFLLTGSANVMTLPTVADSLAGRMETLSLLPLAQSEMEGNTANWIDNVFNARILQTNPLTSISLLQRVWAGGYPNAISRPVARRRAAWLRQYINALVQRDVRDVATVEKLDQLPRFLRALAQTAGQMCNYQKLGMQVGLDGKTAARYIGIFERMYLLNRVDVWARNQLKRVIKTPKLQFIDSGLLTVLLRLNIEQIDRQRFGYLLESFVYGELLKHCTTADDTYNLLYYRDADKYEVDIVIENSIDELVGVEVKAAATVTSRDLRGLRKLASIAADKFKLGVVLYDGNETTPLGDRLWAAPVASLWGT